MPEDPKPPKTFDYTVDREHLEFNVKSFVIGQPVAALVIEATHIDIHLENGRGLRFEARGGDIVMSFMTPVQDPAPTTGWKN